MRTAIIQNCLALDYFLAEEGGVCGKFSQTDCCLQTDDNGKGVIVIAKHIRKIAHVPIQTWKGWDTDGFFGGWFSWLECGGGWQFKIMIGMVIVILARCLLIPCLIPLLIRVVTGFIEAVVEQRKAMQWLLLKEYQQADVL